LGTHGRCGGLDQIALETLRIVSRKKGVGALSIRPEREEVTEMKKTVTMMIGLILSVVAVGCSSGPQPRTGSAPPVIKAFFAVDRIRYGDPMRIYLEAEDPDGDMLRIATSAYQTGGGSYPTDWIYLKPGRGSYFKGYLHWNTSGASAGMSEWTQVTLNVSVFDRAGHESNIMVAPILFESGAFNPPPVPSPFEGSDTERLGYVQIKLKDPTRDNGSSLRRWPEED
jgi:hypothetical protein